MGKRQRQKSVRLHADTGRGSVPGIMGLGRDVVLWDGWRDGGLADLVLALVEQEVGGTGLQEQMGIERVSDCFSRLHLFDRKTVKTAIQ